MKHELCKNQSLIRIVLVTVLFMNEFSLNTACIIRASHNWHLELACKEMKCKCKISALLLLGQNKTESRVRWLVCSYVIEWMWPFFRAFARLCEKQNKLSTDILIEHEVSFISKIKLIKNVQNFHAAWMYVHPLYLEVNYYQQKKIWSRDWIVGSYTEVLLLSTIYFAGNKG